jgi:hypothetical protein
MFTQDDLANALSRRKLHRLRVILQEHPDWDVNLKVNGDEDTGLHMACYFRSDKMVRALLEAPTIQVNVQDKYGRTAFSIACALSHRITRMLAEDPRVDVNIPDNHNRTAFWNACSGCVETIKLLVALRSDIDTTTPGRGWNEDKNTLRTPLECAKYGHDPRVLPFLERFYANPGAVRREVQSELGMPEAQAARLFALVVFFCDGLLRPRRRDRSKRARFLAITQKLPIELQMVVCRRAIGLGGDSIHRELCEFAFRYLARLF